MVVPVLVAGAETHFYSSIYMVAGEEASLVVDTGAPGDWPTLEPLLDELAPRLPPVKYLFPTHAEIPHAGNLGRLLEKFPDARACGDMRDYHLFFPRHTERFLQLRPLDELDLGARTIVILDARFRDLPATQWAFDRLSCVLFAGDGFSYVHHHAAGECGKTAEELGDLPFAEFTAAFAETAFFWTNFTDIEPTVARLSALLEEPPRVKTIAPGHGAPISDPLLTAPKLFAGLRELRQRAVSSS
jgi:glyoxylase-like metal-dependent hydrolase (beta-lactamase superfamily II)